MSGAARVNIERPIDSLYQSLVDFESPGGRSTMRALLFSLGLLACFLFAEPSLTGKVSASAPNLDDAVRTISAPANYQLSPTTEMTVGGGELVSHSTSTQEYFAGAASLSSTGGYFRALADVAPLSD